MLRGSVTPSHSSKAASSGYYYLKDPHLYYHLQSPAKIKQLLGTGLYQLYGNLIVDLKTGDQLELSQYVLQRIPQIYKKNDHVVQVQNNSGIKTTTGTMHQDNLINIHGNCDRKMNIMEGSNQDDHQGKQVGMLSAELREKEDVGKNQYRTGVAQRLVRVLENRNKVLSILKNKKNDNHKQQKSDKKKFIFEMGRKTHRKDRFLNTSDSQQPVMGKVTHSIEQIFQIYANHKKRKPNLKIKSSDKKFKIHVNKLIERSENDHKGVESNNSKQNKRNQEQPVHRQPAQQPRKARQTQQPRSSRQEFPQSPTISKKGIQKLR